MYQLIKQKFSLKRLREALLATEDYYLIEGNYWNDKYWGCIQENNMWVGNNYLGKILMKVRDELKNDN